MNFRELQAAVGMGGPKLAEQAGPVGGGLASEPIGEERTKWVDEQERLRQQQTNYKKGGSVKGWGKARGARKAKVY